MTEGRKPSDAALLRYITKLKRLLFLRVWTIELEDEEPETDATGNLPVASVFVARQANYAKLRVHPMLWQQSAVTQRVTLTHELLHLHVDRLYSDMLTLLKANMPPSALEGVEIMLLDQYERTVDALADAIEQFLPLPEWATIADTRKGRSHGRHEEEVHEEAGGEDRRPLKEDAEVTRS